jgi:hypothetical protein
MQTLNELSGSQLAELYLKLDQTAAELETHLENIANKLEAVRQAGIINCGKEDWLEEIKKAKK